MDSPGRPLGEQVVGIIGLGLMGRPMARRLHGAASGNDDPAVARSRAYARPSRNSRTTRSPLHLEFGSPGAQLRRPRCGGVWGRVHWCRGKADEQITVCPAASSFDTASMHHEFEPNLVLVLALSVGLSATGRAAPPVVSDPISNSPCSPEHPDIVTPIGATFDGRGESSAIESQTHFRPRLRGAARGNYGSSRTPTETGAPTASRPISRG